MVGTARAARVAASGAVAVTGDVGGALHNDAVVAVMAVDQKSKELGAKVSMLRTHCAPGGTRTKVMKKKMQFMMPKAKQAFSIAQVLLACSDHSLLSWMPK